MKSYTLSDVAEYIYMHSHVINFGTQDNTPDDARIKTAENTLDLQFTSSYKSFLKNYGGGEIGGEEIFSIYEIYSGIPAGDIVYRNLLDRRDGFTNHKQLVISTTDFGEIFYFDYSQFQDGESVRSILSFHLAILSITRVIFMNFYVKELRIMQGRIHENLRLS